MTSWFAYAIVAGFMSASASLSAKLSFGPDHLRAMCEAAGATYSTGATDCGWLLGPLWLLSGGLLLTCNTIMWTFFSKALRDCSSTAKATVTTTASNFIFSAVLGRMMFGETHALLWWTGITFTICGLLVLHGSTAQTSLQEEDRKKDM